MERLADIVDRHARALVDGDTAQFASLMTPQAFAGLHRWPEGAARRPRRFAIVELQGDRSFGSSSVRFERGGSFVMQAAWERRQSGWTAVSVSIAPDSVRRPWWKRLRLASRSDAQLRVTRKDLT